MTSYKIVLNDETKRLAQKPSTYREMVMLIERSFAGQMPPQYELRYKDAKDLLINLANEDHFKVMMGSGLTCIKVFVQSNEGVNKSDLQNPIPPSGIFSSAGQASRNDYNLNIGGNQKQSEFNFQEERSLKNTQNCHNTIRQKDGSQEKSELQLEDGSGPVNKSSNLTANAAEAKSLEKIIFDLHAKCSEAKKASKDLKFHIADLKLIYHDDIDEEEKVNLKEKIKALKDQKSKKDKLKSQLMAEIQEKKKTLAILTQKPPREKNDIKGLLRDKKDASVRIEGTTNMYQITSKMVEESVDKVMSNLYPLVLKMVYTKLKGQARENKNWTKSMQNTFERIPTETSIETEAPSKIPPIQYSNKPPGQPLKHVPSFPPGLGHFTGNYHCNNCSLRILGNRFHCTQCPDFDFCAKCEEEVSHPHELIKIQPYVKQPRVICKLAERKSEEILGKCVNFWNKISDMLKLNTSEGNGQVFPDCPESISNEKLNSRVIKQYVCPKVIYSTKEDIYCTIELMNIGTEPWPRGTRLCHLGGLETNDPPTIFDFVLPNGTAKATIKLKNHKIVGEHKTQWILGYPKAPESIVHFGQVITVFVNVLEEPVETDPNKS